MGHNDNYDLRVKRPGVPTQSGDETSKFAKDVIWISMAQLFIAFILGILVLPALTKYYSPEIYGIWTQVIITIELMAPLVSLQLGLAAVKYLAVLEDPAKKRRFLGSMLLAIVLFASILSIAAIPFATQLSVLLFADPIYVDLIWLVLIWIFFNTFYNFLLSYLQAQSKNQVISINRIAMTIMKVISIISLAIMGASISHIIISQIVLQAVFSLLLLAGVVREIGLPMPNTTGLKTFLVYSVPQMPSVVLLWIIRMSDRYFITHFLDLSQDGIYSSSVTLANLSLLFSVPISFVLFPLTARLWGQKRLEAAKSYTEYSFKLFLTLAIPGTVGLSILSQPLLKVLTTSQFLAGEGLVFLVTSGILFFGIYQINANIMLLDKRAKLVPLVTAIGSVTNVVMNVILIPQIGITGAGLSSLSSYFMIALITTFITRKIICYNLNFIYYGKVITSTLVMLVCLYFLKVDDIWSIILAIVVGVMVYAVGLLLLRTFSDQDKKLIKETFANLMPVHPGGRK
jgi:O-antigen/teichoic acid export membrane protein